ncbi:hypothetical protein M514_20931 [Trichuris suis]|uniref:Integrase catalytic domain-containing protein n=1 Tax=Trichuris suis TaxID=68888 RepID=A0A085NBE1_9BILA|nr:hypothetical protein M514_20931 [Trichuris suis]KHJ42035.1 hypothetical protein D918_07925 [Trichuris suis]
MPVGMPWERLGADILELPKSTAGHRYALVVQDYFTKWLSVFPLKSPTAAAVAQQLIQLFYQMGPPRIVHADQGRNFESDLLKEVCRAFGLRKRELLPTILKDMDS